MVLDDKESSIRHFRNRIDPVDDLFFEDELEEQGTVETVVAQMEHYITHPSDWVEDMVGIKLQPWQRDVLTDLALHRFVSVRSGHGVGKSCLMALALLWFLATHPYSLVIATAPSKEQLLDVLWRECAKWIRESSRLDEIFQWRNDCIEVKADPKEWYAVARTAAIKKSKDGGTFTVEGLQGRHSEALLYLIDEAAGVDEAVLETIEGALTTPYCYVLMAGNPNRTTGTFYKSHNEERHLWKTHHVNSEDCDNCERAYVSRMLTKCHGNREHPLYLIRVRGEFPPATFNQLYPLRDIVRCQSLQFSVPAIAPVRIGIDPARFGDDATCFCVTQGDDEIIHLRMDLFNQLNTMEIAGYAVNYIREYKPVSVRIDEIGMGAGVIDRLHELGFTQVIGVNSSAKPETRKDPSEPEYLNLRSQLNWNLARLIQTDKIQLLNDDFLTAEMLPITYKFTSDGKIQIKSKDDMKADGHDSPNRTDALALAVAKVTKLITRKTAKVSSKYRSTFGTLPIFGR